MNSLRACYDHGVDGFPVAANWFLFVYYTPLCCSIQQRRILSSIATNVISHYSLEHLLFLSHKQYVDRVPKRPVCVSCAKDMRNTNFIGPCLEQDILM